MSSNNDYDIRAKELELKEREIRLKEKELQILEAKERNHNQRNEQLTNMASSACEGVTKATPTILKVAGIAFIIGGIVTLKEGMNHGNSDELMAGVACIGIGLFLSFKLRK